MGPWLVHAQDQATLTKHMWKDLYRSVKGESSREKFQSIGHPFYLHSVLFVNSSLHKSPLPFVLARNHNHLLALIGINGTIPHWSRLEIPLTDLFHVCWWWVVRSERSECISDATMCYVLLLQQASIPLQSRLRRLKALLYYPRSHVEGGREALKLPHIPHG